jgi:flagellar motor component MotA
MFVLWMFGSELERLWGKNRFIKFYFFTGIGAGIVTMIFSYNSTIPIVGASGAVYGILLAYGFIYPNRKVYLYGIIPIKSIWFVIAVGFLAFISSINNNSNISHLTHLSGMVVAYLILKNPFQLKTIWFSIQKKFIETKLKKETKERSKQKKIELDLNFILDKINREGYVSLTDEEQDQLYKSSKALSLHKKKD